MSTVTGTNPLGIIYRATWRGRFSPLRMKFHQHVEAPVERLLLNLFGRTLPCGCETLRGRIMRVRFHCALDDAHRNGRGQK